MTVTPKKYMIGNTVEVLRDSRIYTDNPHKTQHGSKDSYRCYRTKKVRIDALWTEDGTGTRMFTWRDGSGFMYWQPIPPEHLES